MDSTSLLVEIEKKFFSFSVLGSLGDRHTWGCFCLFLDTVGRPWAPTHWAILLAQDFFGN